jgi:hypothetical protein
MTGIDTSTTDLKRQFVSDSKAFPHQLDAKLENNNSDE